MWYKQKFFRFSTAIVLVLLIIYLASQVLPVIQSVFSLLLTLVLPTIFAWLLYYIFRPLRDYLQSHKVPKLAAISLIFVILAAIVGVVVLFIWPFVSAQVAEFTATPTGKIKDVQKKTLNFLNFLNLFSISQEQLRETSAEFFHNIVIYLSNNILVTISSITQIATYIIVTPFILFYILKDDHQMALNFYKLIPKANKNKVKKVLGDVDQTLSVYIHAQVLIALIVSFLIFIGYWAIGLNYSFLLAWFAFLFNLIPFCGPIISTIPALFIGLSQGPWMGFKVVFIVLLVHLIDMNLISPRLVGGQLNIHPVMIILLLLMSFSLFGLLGMLLVTPLYAVLKTLFLDLYQMQQDASSED